MLLALAATLLAACGSSRGGGGDEAGQEERAPVPPTKVSITARDYDFNAPDTMPGGLVELSFTNAGKEPHFAGLARAAAGKTFEEVEAALTAPPPSAPPPGPPPFEEVAGMPTTDPGRVAKLTVNLPAGTYALFCVIPSPDGITHAHKGMVKRLTVTEGTPGPLPQSGQTVVSTDFALTQIPALKAGTNVVRLRNEGRQLHEINLVELGPGKTVDDVVEWYRRPAGPPPMASLGGVAVRPGEEGAATLELNRGATYAFVCAIPDVLGDFALHLTKGMFIKPVTVP